VEQDISDFGKFHKPSQVWNCKAISLNLVNLSCLMFVLMLNS